MDLGLFIIIAGMVFLLPNALLASLVAAKSFIEILLGV